MKIIMSNIPKEIGKKIVEEYYGKSFSWKESENSISTYLHSTKIEITDDEE